MLTKSIQKNHIFSITLCKIRRRHTTKTMKFLHESAYRRWTCIIWLYYLIDKYGIKTNSNVITFTQKDSEGITRGACRLLYNPFLKHFMDFIINEFTMRERYRVQFAHKSVMWFNTDFIFIFSYTLRLRSKKPSKRRHLPDEHLLLQVIQPRK